MRLFTFTQLRITILLSILLFAAFYTVHQNIFSRSWNSTLQIIVYPINGDESEATRNYIKSLSSEQFESIDNWTTREAKRYNMPLKNPTKVTLGKQIRSIPPPLAPHQNPVETLIWGLKMRWWAYNNTPDNLSNLERIRMFIVYRQGDDDEPLPHSLGLQKGLIGVVHAYSTHRQSNQNNIVISHEMLHTVGAVDKYGENGMPVYPQGYARPDSTPLYPQRYAEIMSGHIPVSSESSYMADSLKSVLINPYTATEINWRN